MQVLRALLKREDALRAGWNKDSFGDIGTTGMIDDALRSELFWKYASFLNGIAGCLDVGSSWCEGCQCHEHLHLQHNGFQSRKREIQLRLQSAIGGDSQKCLPYPPSCPLKGRRSPELACGAFERLLSETMQVMKDMLDGFRESLSPSLRG